MFNICRKLPKLPKMAKKQLSRAYKIFVLTFFLIYIYPKAQKKGWTEIYYEKSKWWHSLLCTPSIWIIRQHNTYFISSGQFSWNREWWEGLVQTCFWLLSLLSFSGWVACGWRIFCSAWPRLCYSQSWSLNSLSTPPTRVPFIWSKHISSKYHFIQISCIQKSTFGHPKF